LHNNNIYYLNLTVNNILLDTNGDIKLKDFQYCL